MSSPKILSHRWGALEIEGLGSVRDAKLFPGGARAWDWRETDTHHTPGIQPADVQELIDAGAATVILSRGVLEHLQVMPETLALLADHAIEVQVLQTDAAVEAYNALAGGARVGALIHSTC